jgi:hypothetical protein
MVAGALSLVLLVGAFFSSPAAADRLRCSSELGALAEAKLDDAVDTAWQRCPCDWTARRKAAQSARRAFGRCVKATARTLVNEHELAPSCYREVAGSARHSTCGRAGAVTCCVPTAERCVVLSSAPEYRPVSVVDPRTGLPSSPTGLSQPVTVTGAERCDALPGASLGKSPSCYDACPPPGKSACTTEQDTDAAMQRAKARIAAAQGTPFDGTDARQVGLLLLQTPHEHPCFLAGRITKDFGRER